MNAVHGCQEDTNSDASKQLSKEETSKGSWWCPATLLSLREVQSERAPHVMRSPPNLPEFCSAPKERCHRVKWVTPDRWSVGDALQKSDARRSFTRDWKRAREESNNAPSDDRHPGWQRTHQSALFISRGHLLSAFDLIRNDETRTFCDTLCVAAAVRPELLWGLAGNRSRDPREEPAYEHIRLVRIESNPARA